jgi:uncharacterized membrane protein YeaQ/YmgE (transglycosylase-associated protein family)
MSVVELLILLVIAGICGSLAQSLTGYSRGGCLVAIALGFIGAILGSKLAQILGMHEMLALRVGSESFPVLWSIIGAALFVAILNVFSPPRRKQ